MSNVPPPPPPPPPPGMPPGPPPGYSPYGGFTPAPSSSKKAMWAMITGILGLVICAPLAIVAIVLGKQAQAEIDAAHGTIAGRGQATAGFVLGIIGLALWVVLIALSLS